MQIIFVICCGIGCKKTVNAAHTLAKSGWINEIFVEDPTKPTSKEFIELGISAKTEHFYMQGMKLIGVTGMHKDTGQGHIEMIVNLQQEKGSGQYFLIGGNKARNFRVEFHDRNTSIFTKK